MGIISSLKLLWGSTNRVNSKTPLQRHSQYVEVYIKGIEAPFRRVLEFEDYEVYDWVMRVDLERDLNKWLNQRGVDGVRIDSIWYPPDQIERIVLKESTVEPIE